MVLVPKPQNLGNKAIHWIMRVEGCTADPNEIKKGEYGTDNVDTIRNNIIK
jgi:hypothetical protein